MGKKSDTIYFRKCFACGNPMTLRQVDWPILHCEGCEVWENGTIKGRYHHIDPLPFEWLGEYITFIDHSKVHLPSPDVIAQATHAEQPVQSVKVPL